MEGLTNAQLGRLGRWFGATLGCDPDALAVTPLTDPEDRNNHTSLVTAGDDRWILRCPPDRRTFPSAHDMGREHRVLRALEHTSVPAPRPIGFCSDPNLIGRVFHVTTFCPGTAPASTADLDGLDRAQRQRCSADLMVHLAHLHALDPAEIGLCELGRSLGPARSLRMLQDLGRALGHERHPSARGLREVLARVLAHEPKLTPPRLAHRDYRIDNVLADLSGSGGVLAVIDWETADLGQAAGDLGKFLAVWNDPHPEFEAFTPIATDPEGFLTHDEMVHCYVSAGGTDLVDLAWYEIVALCEMAGPLIVMGQKRVADASGRDASGLAAHLVERCTHLLAELPAARRTWSAATIHRVIEDADPFHLDTHRLAAWLTEQVGPVEAGELQVEPVTASSSGTLLRLAIGPGRWWLRVPQATGAFTPPPEMGREFAILRALEHEGVPAPRPLALSMDPQIIGGPCLLMSDLAGSEEGPSVPADADDDARLALAEGLIELLARIHRIPPHLHHLEVHCAAIAAQDHVAGLTGWVQPHHLQACAPLEELRRVLRASTLPAVPVRLVHRRFGLRRCCYPDLTPRARPAIAGWRTAGIDDPLKELGQVLAQWSHPEAWADDPGPWASGVGLRRHLDRLLSTYATVSGVDPGSIADYRRLAVFGHARRRLATLRQNHSEDAEVHEAIRWAGELAARELELTT